MFWAVTLVAVVAAAGLGVADVANAVVHRGSATPTATPTATAKPLAHAAPVASGVQAIEPLQVLTIGDSIMKGFGLDPSEPWPELLSAQDGWQLTTMATNGAGFLTEGDSGNTFVDLARAAAALHPDLIVIQGSSNDFGQSNAQLAAATTQGLALLRAEFPSAKIIGLSMVWSETTPPAQTAAINSQVEAAVTAVGGTYLDVGQPLGEHAELMQGDDVHPTAAGQVVLARAIGVAIDAQRASDRAAIIAAALAAAPGHL